ncbi:MAG: hypothetical protein KAS72_09135 [Phycisphaerales bacterium]|nr:hypothetical protein [Phycisphaerales bacterium]
MSDSIHRCGTDRAAPPGGHFNAACRFQSHEHVTCALVPIVLAFMQPDAKPFVYFQF